MFIRQGSRGSAMWTPPGEVFFFFVFYCVCFEVAAHMEGEQHQNPWFGDRRRYGTGLLVAFPMVLLCAALVQPYKKARDPEGGGHADLIQPFCIQMGVLVCEGVSLMLLNMLIHGEAKLTLLPYENWLLNVLLRLGMQGLRLFKARHGKAQAPWDIFHAQTLEDVLFFLCAVPSMVSQCTRLITGLVGGNCGLFLCAQARVPDEGASTDSSSLEEVLSGEPPPEGRSSCCCFSGPQK